MNISERNEERRVIEIAGIEFYVENLVQPLGWLRRGSIEDELVNTDVLVRMEKAGLVRKKTSGGFMSMPDEEPTTTWEQVDGQCRELFEELNEPYHRLRPKIDTTATQSFGMWDEQEDDRARQKACHAKARLERRNPDVTFKLHEEELNAIPVTR